MVVLSEKQPGRGAGVLPAEFRAAVESLRSARLRPEVLCEEAPAPQRIAPYAVALSADVVVDDVEVATGRLILLHDPEGNEAWDGTFRCVAYVRAEVGEEQLSDEPGMLGGDTWSRLVEALDAHGAAQHALAGSVTSVRTECYGSMAEDDASAQVEVRASWTPTTLELVRHVEAWGELLCAAGGLQPVPEGVTAMSQRRGQRAP